MRRSEWAVLVFNLGYLALAFDAAREAGNQEFVFYIVVMAGLIAAVGLLHWRLRFPPPVLWALSGWGALHMAGGLWPVRGDVLYNLWLIPGWLKYDMAVHAYGFGVATWVIWLGLAPQLADPRPRLGLMVICVAAGTGLGALNEVIEFIATQIVPETNVGGYTNTALDLVCNLIGAVVAVILIRAASPRALSSDSD